MSLDVHDHLHAHGDYLHRHPHGHGPGAHGHADEQTPLARLDRSGLGRFALYDWLRPFVVGLVHGLAGSAAVALMILSIISEPVGRARLSAAVRARHYPRNDADHADPVGAVCVHGCQSAKIQLAASRGIGFGQLLSSGQS